MRNSPMISINTKIWYILEYQKKYSFKIYDGRVGEKIDKNHLVITKSIIILVLYMNYEDKMIEYFKKRKKK